MYINVLAIQLYIKYSNHKFRCVPELDDHTCTCTTKTRLPGAISRSILYNVHVHVYVHVGCSCSPVFI